MSPASHPGFSHKESGVNSRTGFLAVAGAALTSLPAALPRIGTLGVGIFLKKLLPFPPMALSFLHGLWGAVRSFRRHGSPFLFLGYPASALALPPGMMFCPSRHAGRTRPSSCDHGGQNSRARSRPACSPKRKESLP